MKNVLLTIAFAIVAIPAFSQDADSTKYWTTGGNSSFTFNQISLKNWAGGGKNSLTGTFLFKTFANYKKDKVAWDNTLDLGYGMTKYNSEDVQKTEDKIHLSSIFGYEVGKTGIFYSALADFKTQFAKGYKYTDNDTTLVSKAFSPAYINISLGMQYKPNSVFSLYLSPLTGRVTVVGDTILSPLYGVDNNEKSRFEYGAYAKLLVNKPNIIQNVDYFLRADFFSNLTENPEKIDVDIETGLNLKINNFLTAIVTVNLLFDDDIKHKETSIDSNGDKITVERGARLQCKQLFGFGLTYKW